MTEHSEETCVSVYILEHGILWAGLVYSGLVLSGLVLSGLAGLVWSGHFIFECAQWYAVASWWSTHNELKWLVKTTSLYIAVVCGIYLALACITINWRTQVGAGVAGRKGSALNCSTLYWLHCIALPSAGCGKIAQLCHHKISCCEATLNICFTLRCITQVL